MGSIMKKIENFIAKHIFEYILIAILVLVIVATIWLFKVNTLSPNEASLYGGVLGAYATVLLGLIAFYQNKRYKELADEMNDRTYMPEIYKPTSVSESFESAIKASKNIAYFGVDSKEETKQLDCSSFGVLNSPIIDLSVKSVSNSKKTVQLIGRKMSLYNEDVGFCVFLMLPSDFIEPNYEYSVTFEYKNIYGTKYEKDASFSLNGYGNPANWKLERARRVS